VQRWARMSDTKQTIASARELLAAGKAADAYRALRPAFIGVGESLQDTALFGDAVKLLASLSSSWRSGESIQAWRCSSVSKRRMESRLVPLTLLSRSVET